MSVTAMLENSSYLSSNEAVAKAEINITLSVVYGINPDNILTSLTNAIFSRAVTIYPGVTVKDMQNAFTGPQIERKSFGPVTRDEFLQPVQKYWKSKMALLNAIKDLEVQADIEAQAAVKAAEFWETCWDALRKSWKAKRWIGTPFQALELVRRDVCSSIPEDVRIEIWEKSVLAFKTQQRMLDESTQPIAFEVAQLMTAERICADAMLDFLCTNQLIPVKP